MGRVIAVVGAIPGAGATTVASAVGAALAEQRHEVAVVDATREGSRLADVRDAETDRGVRDALRRGVALRDVLVRDEHGAALIPAGSSTAWGSVRPDAVDEWYADLRERFDATFVDCGTGLSVETSAWIGHADEVVIVTQPDADDAVRDLMTALGTLGVEPRGLVLNRVPLQEVADAAENVDVRAPVLAVLPEDSTVEASAEAGKSPLVHDPDSPIAECVWRLAPALLEGIDEPILPGDRRPLVAAGAGGQGADTRGTPSADPDPGNGTAAVNSGSADEVADSDAAAGAASTDAEAGVPADANSADTEADVPADADSTDPGAEMPAEADTAVPSDAADGTSPAPFESDPLDGDAGSVDDGADAESTADEARRAPGDDSSAEAGSNADGSTDETATSAGTDDEGDDSTGGLGAAVGERLQFEEDDESGAENEPENDDEPEGDESGDEDAGIQWADDELVEEPEAGESESQVSGEPTDGSRGESDGDASDGDGLSSAIEDIIQGSEDRDDGADGSPRAEDSIDEDN